MTMLTAILLVAIVAFVAYALYTQFKNTDPKQGIVQRAWASFVLAAAALGALIMSLLKGAGAP